MEASKHIPQQLAVYPDKFKAKVEKRIDDILPILGEFFGVKLERPTVHYSPYPNGIAGAAYLDSENAIIITPALLRASRLRMKKSFDRILAHELAHGFFHVLSGISDPDKMTVKQVFDILAMPDGGTAKMVEMTDKAKDWEKTFMGTNEGVAEIAAAYVVRRLRDKSTDGASVIKYVLRNARVQGMSAKLALNPEKYKFLKYILPGAKKDFENIARATSIDKTGAARMAYNGYMRPQVLLAREYIDELMVDDRKPLQRFVIEATLRSVPPSMLNNSPLWDNLPKQITPLNYELWDGELKEKVAPKMGILEDIVVKVRVNEMSKMAMDVRIDIMRLERILRKKAKSTA